MCTPVQGFVILSMQRSGSGWFETLLNNHPNISSHGEIFKVKPRRQNFTTIAATLDAIYNLDWYSSAAKNECTSAVGFKWMLNQVSLHHHMLWIVLHIQGLIDPIGMGFKNMESAL
jgi:LPS sulfotransferase NodH